MSVTNHDITPDISLMPKIGKSGYSSPQAIAELVDNSIDARLDGTLLEINIKIDKSAISIADNGTGMNEKFLVKALTLAHSEKKNSLGEFGFGLKTACTSLGGRFDIITSPTNKTKQFSTTYDEEQWLKGKNWQISVKTENEADSSHFTIVKISKLKRYWPQLPSVLKNDIEKRFAPFIAKREISVKVNGKICKPGKYDLIEKTYKKFIINVEKGKAKGEKIHGWYGLLKEGSNKGLYGFHTYRRGRMITTYDKIAIGEHPTISRIIGEIHLDFIPVTHNKKEFIVESEEYTVAEEYLRGEFKELLKEARKKSGQDRIKKHVIDELEVWKEKISRAVIESSDLKSYTSQLDSKTGMAKDELGENEIIAAEKRGQGDNEGTVKPKKTGQERLPKKKHEQKKKIIKIKGKQFEFDHQFVSLGSEASWKSYEFDKKKRKIVVYTNTDFPSYMVTKDVVFYAVIHIAEAIAEVMVHEVGEEIGNMQEIKETILKVASNLKSQINE